MDKGTANSGVFSQTLYSTNNKKSNLEAIEYERPMSTAWAPKRLINYSPPKAYALKPPNCKSLSSIVHKKDHQSLPGAKESPISR